MEGSSLVVHSASSVSLFAWNANSEGKSLKSTRKQWAPFGKFANLGTHWVECREIIWFWILFGKRSYQQSFDCPTACPAITEHVKTKTIILNAFSNREIILTFNQSTDVFRLANCSNRCSSQKNNRGPHRLRCVTFRTGPIIGSSDSDAHRTQPEIHRRAGSEKQADSEPLNRTLRRASTEISIGSPIRHIDKKMNKRFELKNSFSIGAHSLCLPNSFALYRNAEVEDPMHQGRPSRSALAHIPYTSHTHRSFQVVSWES